MIKLKRRIGSAFLACMMLLSLLPVTALAATPEEGSASSNPFTTVEEYNTAVQNNGWNGEDIYLTINSQDFDTNNLFSLTNVQNRANPPKLHLTLTNCTFTGNTANDSRNPAFMYLSNCQELVIDNCTFDAGTDGLKYGINWNLIQIKDATVSITNCSFEGKFEKNPLKLNQRGGDDDKAADIQPTDGDKKAASIASAVIENCTFTCTKQDGTTPNNVIQLGSQGKGAEGAAAPSTGAFPVTIAAGSTPITVEKAYSAAQNGNISTVDVAANTVVTKEADEDPQVNNAAAVAKIGDTPFVSLEAACSAVQDGQTISVQKDITSTRVVTMSGQNVTLDLGGKTITNANGAVLVVKENSSVTIKNGTLFSSNTSWTPTLGTEKNVTLTIASDATVVGPYGLGLDNHTPEGGSGVTIHVYGTVRGVNDSDNTNLLNSGGTVGIGINGMIKSKDNYATIYIYDGATVSGSHGKSGSANNDDGPAIYAAGYAKWIIEDGATISGDEALSIKSGNFTINGGTFTATGTYVDPATSWGNGTEATGAAISITNNNSYAKNVEMAISGGTFTSANGYAIYESDTKNQEGSALGTEGLKITGGTFTGATAVGAVSSKNAQQFISGGNFSCSINEKFLNDSIKAELKSAANTEAPYSYYTSMEDALAAAQPGDVVVAIGDIGNKTCLVTVKNGDKIVDKAEVIQNGMYILPDAPSRAGYSFRGWYGNGHLYAAGEAVQISKDTVFVAQWSDNTPYYTITVKDADNGTVTCYAKSAAKGADVTLNVKADVGYQLDKLTVTDASGNVIDVEKVNNTTYTFVMPGSKVTVEAVFAPTTVVEPSGLPFTDVSTSDWFYGAVKFVYENGLMDGVGNNLFAPNATLNRAMAVTILYRLEGSPAVTTDAGFNDVAAGTWYTDAVNWAAANNIVNGVEGNNFDPTGSLTREQMATVLYRYAQYKGADVSASGDIGGFVDSANVSSWAADAVKWAVGSGLVNGVEGNALAPQGTSTRAQAATVLMRFVG